MLSELDHNGSRSTRLTTKGLPLECGTDQKESTVFGSEATPGPIRRSKYATPQERYLSQTPHKPKSKLVPVPTWSTQNADQWRQDHSPALSVPLARCVELRSFPQTKKVITIQENLDMLPKILVHLRKAKT